MNLKNIFLIFLGLLFLVNTMATNFAFAAATVKGDDGSAFWS